MPTSSASDTEFIRALAARPDDEATRLVYIDWLRSRGDPRGRYLQVELESSRTSPLNPRYFELKAERQAFRADADPDWLDSVGYALAYTPLFTELPKDRAEFWRRIDRFLECWQGDSFGPHSAVSATFIANLEKDLGLAIPRAVAEWYRLAGAQLDTWLRNDPWCLPEQLERYEEGDFSGLCVKWENQSVVAWGVRDSHLMVENPPVTVLREFWRQEAPTFTEFLLVSLMWETWGPRGGYIEDVPADSPVRAEFARKLTRVNLSPHTCYWAMEQVSHFEGRDLRVCGGASDGWLYFNARNATALDILSEETRGQIVPYGLA